MAQRPTLYTERLILRPFSLDDAGEVQRLAGAREVADTTLNIPHPYKDGMAEAWISTHQVRFDEGASATFALTLRAEGQPERSGPLIGAIGLEINQRHQRAELGYWIGVPHWRQGYATEAARAVVAYAFRSLGLHKIVAYHLPRNPASGRVMKKLGMQREAYLREHVRKGDTYEDLVGYGLVRSDWEALTRHNVE